MPAALAEAPDRPEELEPQWEKLKVAVHKLQDETVEVNLMEKREQFGGLRR